MSATHTQFKRQALILGSAVLAVFLLLCYLLPAVALAEESEEDIAYIVSDTGDKVHLRKEPSKNADSMGLYFVGTQVTLCGQTDGTWTKIRIGQEEGYMMSRFLSSDEGFLHSKCRSGTMKTDDVVSLRDTPSEDGASVAKLYEYSVLTVYGETKAHWYYVSYGDVYGYVKKKYVELGDVISPSASGEIPEEYRKVLNNTETFDLQGNEMFEYAKDMLLSEFLKEYSRQSKGDFKIAIVDIDWDGKTEIILAYPVKEIFEDWYLVLDARNGKVSGHGFWPRAMKEIKYDGTFSYSSGAGDFGFGYAQFDPYRKIVDLACSITEKDGKTDCTYYYVENKQVSKRELDKAMEQYEKKPSAVWYDYVIQ